MHRPAFRQSWDQTSTAAGAAGFRFPGFLQRKQIRHKIVDFFRRELGRRAVGVVLVADGEDVLECGGPTVMEVRTGAIQLDELRRVELIAFPIQLAQRTDIVRLHIRMQRPAVARGARRLPLKYLLSPLGSSGRLAVFAKERAGDRLE